MLEPNPKCARNQSYCATDLFTFQQATFSSSGKITEFIHNKRHRRSRRNRNKNRATISAVESLRITGSVYMFSALDSTRVFLVVVLRTTSHSEPLPHSCPFSASDQEFLRPPGNQQRCSHPPVCLLLLQVMNDMPRIHLVTHSRKNRTQLRTVAAFHKCLLQRSP